VLVDNKQQGGSCFLAVDRWLGGHACSTWQSILFTLYWEALCPAIPGASTAVQSNSDPRDRRGRVD
jgi:hypothetical protein